jgi:hypothetical protein
MDTLLPEICCAHWSAAGGGRIYDIGTSCGLLAISRSSIDVSKFENKNALAAHRARRELAAFAACLSMF